MLKDKAYIQAKGGRAEIWKEPSPCRYYWTAALPMPALTAVDEKSLSQFSILTNILQTVFICYVTQRSQFLKLVLYMHFYRWDKRDLQGTQLIWPQQELNVGLSDSIAPGKKH